MNLMPLTGIIHVHVRQAKRKAHLSRFTRAHSILPYSERIHNLQCKQLRFAWFNFLMEVVINVCADEESGKTTKPVNSPARHIRLGCIRLRFTKLGRIDYRRMHLLMDKKELQYSFLFPSRGCWLTKKTASIHVGWQLWYERYTSNGKNQIARNELNIMFSMREAQAEELPLYGRTYELCSLCV